MTYDHRLHGSTIPVLSAMACQWEMAKFDHPHRIHTPHRSPKNLLHVITPATAMAVSNSVQIRARGDSEEMGEILFLFVHGDS